MNKKTSLDRKQHYGASVHKALVTCREFALERSVEHKNEKHEKTAKYQKLFGELAPNSKWIFNINSEGFVFSIIGSFIKQNILNSNQDLDLDLTRQIASTFVEGQHQIIIDLHFGETCQQNPLS